MNINWKELITTKYWLGIDRGMIHLTDKIILGVGASLVILGIIVLLYKLFTGEKLLKPVISRIASVFITVGLLEMLWYFLRTQYVTALGSRLAALIVGLVGLYFLYQPIKYFFRQYGTDHAEYNKQQLKEKYLKM